MSDSHAGFQHLWKGHRETLKATTVEDYFGGGLVAKSCPTLATPWTETRQAPRSVGLSGQEYWSGLPFPSPGDLPGQGSNTGLLHCRQIRHQLSYDYFNPHHLPLQTTPCSPFWQAGGLSGQHSC